MIDITSAMAAIADAETAIVSVIGSMIVLGAGIYGLKKIIRLIGGPTDNSRHLYSDRE